jgi:hypothetical protein
VKSGTFAPGPTRLVLRQIKEQNDGITIADAMREGFTKSERWSVTKQGQAEDVQESYTGDRLRKFIVKAAFA